MSWWTSITQVIEIDTDQFVHGLEQSGEQVIQTRIDECVNGEGVLAAAPKITGSEYPADVYINRTDHEYYTTSAPSPACFSPHEWRTREVLHDMLFCAEMPMRHFGNKLDQEAQGHEEQH